MRNIRASYNSTVSFEVHNEVYSVLMMTPAEWTKWSTRSSFNNRANIVADQAVTSVYDIAVLQHMVSEIDQLQKLQPDECIKAYGKRRNKSYSDVILILDLETIRPDTYNYLHTTSGGTEWVCASQTPCDIDNMVSNSDNWRFPVGERNKDKETLYGRVDYCLSKPKPEDCKLILDAPLLSIVVGCNILKLIGMIVTWLSLNSRCLLTLGGIKAIQIHFLGTFRWRH